MRQTNVVNLNRYKLRKSLTNSIKNVRVRNGKDMISFDSSHAISAIYNFPELFNQVSKQDRIDRAVQLHHDLEFIEYRTKEILARLRTVSNKFKVVGVSTLYKNTLNPIFALQNELEKALLTLPKNHIRRKWLISLFSNTVWKKTLLSAIEEDIVSITLFLKEIQDKEDALSRSDLPVKLNHTKMRLISCRLLFLRL